MATGYGGGIISTELFRSNDSKGKSSGLVSHTPSRWTNSEPRLDVQDIWPQIDCRVSTDNMSVHCLRRYMAACRRHSAFPYLNWRVRGKLQQVRPQKGCSVDGSSVPSCRSSSSGSARLDHPSRGVRARFLRSERLGNAATDPVGDSDKSRHGWLN